MVVEKHQLPVVTSAFRMLDYLTHGVNRQVGRRGSLKVLTAENVKNIRKRFRQGVILKEIVAEFGVSQTTVSSIKAGRSWKNVS